MGKQADVCFLHVLLRFVTKPYILTVINAGNNIILFHFKQLLLCILQTHVQFCCIPHDSFSTYTIFPFRQLHQVNIPTKIV